MLDAHKDLLTLEPFREPKDLDGEIWRNIEGYDGLYQVSNCGRVKSYRGLAPRLLKLVPIHGYLLVGLWTGDKQILCRVHRLVAEAFIPNPENKPEVNHINGVKTDNRAENLEWATPAENTRHAWRTGLSHTAQGVNDSQAKLTEEQVIYVRNNPDGLTGKALAARFGVGAMTISRIQRGKRYRNTGGKIRE